MKTANKARKAEEPARRRKSAAGQTDPAGWRWADPRSLKVNPAFQGLIPLQVRGEYMALEQSIQAEGCLDPLLVWKDRGVVLDGHTRRDLCIEHKKQVKVREIELPDEKAAVEYILRIQRQRRNLTREAMSYFRGAEYNAVKQRRGGRRPAREAKARFVPLPTTAVRLAEKYGVSDKTIKRDAIFAQVMDKIAADYGDPEVKRKLLGADVKLTQATARLLLRTPAEDRKAVVDRLIDRGELPRAKKPGAAATPPPKEVAQSIVARLKARGEDHARSVLQHMASLLGMEVPENVADN